ncbi:MAG: FAD binding domain-containing protein [Deferrisomatales bacterium]|nr:FAD binding domain-containing protein [Deferrisomatales bacterium]
MLRVPHVTLHRPNALDLALETLAAEPGAGVIAGGTDLVPALKYGLCRPEALVALSGLPLGGIEPTGSAWRLGAGTTLWKLERWAAPGALGVVPRAAALVAVPPVRSRATLGGNLCLDTRCGFLNQTAFWRSGRPACFKAGGEVCHVVPGGAKCHACHQSDLAPALVALGATVLLRTARGERILPLEDLYTGRGDVPLGLHPGELLCSVEIPTPGVPSGAAYQKLRVRRGMDFPAVSAAVYVEQDPAGVCRGARVVLGAVASLPLRVPEAEALLEGSTLEPAVLDAAAAACVAAARPVKNVDLTPAYRKKMAGVLFRRAAREAWEGC